MFTLDNYKVRFAHSQYPSGTWCKGVTTCEIFNAFDESGVGYGLTYCSRSDQFNKATGRKVALTRALKAFDKETRTRFWKAYFKAQGGVK